MTFLSHVALISPGFVFAMRIRRGLSVSSAAGGAINRNRGRGGVLSGLELFRSVQRLCDAVEGTDGLFTELKMSEIRRANDCAVVLFRQQHSEMFLLLCSLRGRRGKQWICKAVISQTFPLLTQQRYGTEETKSESRNDGGGFWERRL